MKPAVMAKTVKRPKTAPKIHDAPGVSEEDKARAKKAVIAAKQKPAKITATKKTTKSKK